MNKCYLKGKKKGKNQTIISQRSVEVGDGRYESGCGVRGKVRSWEDVGGESAIGKISKKKSRTGLTWRLKDQREAESFLIFVFISKNREKIERLHQ